MILEGTIFAMLLVMALALIRAAKGPTIYDRILATNLFGTKTVLLIAVLAFASGSTFLLDIAMVYALINFVSVIGALQYFEQQTDRGEP